MITPQNHLLVAWITVAAVSILGVVVVLVWAVRTHQFSKQDRARYLALDSGIPPEEGSTKVQEPKKEPSTSDGKPTGEGDRVSD